MSADGQPPGSDQRHSRRIVVGVDGSEDSTEALAWAAHEARLRDATLEVVYSLFFRTELLEQFPDILDHEKSILDHAVVHAQELEPLIKVLGRIVEPPAAKALIDISSDVDLLVVGSRGRGGFRELMLGSVSHQCVEHAKCPVAVVRSQPQAGGAGESD